MFFKLYIRKSRKRVFQGVSAIKQAAETEPAIVVASKQARTKQKPISKVSKQYVNPRLAGCEVLIRVMELNVQTEEHEDFLLK